MSHCADMAGSQRNSVHQAKWHQAKEVTLSSAQKSPAYFAADTNTSPDGNRLKDLGGLQESEGAGDIEAHQRRRRL